MNVDIERATAEDGPSILQLLRDAEPPVDGLLDHLDTAFVARVDGRIIGCAALEMYEGGALLRSVAVASVVQGFGIGRRLTGAAITLAESLGVPAVYLLTTSAERYFPKLAFVPITRAQVPASVQESVEFRTACPASAVVMRRTLRDVTKEGPHWHPRRAPSRTTHPGATLNVHPSPEILVPSPPHGQERC
jgi:amino-acid N-acetyltransferase